MIDTLALNIVAYNEGHRIYDTITDAAKHVDEIVVVDQSSTDNTASEARRAGATVLTDVHHGYCEPSRQMALDATWSEWALVLDADECLSDDFVAELRTFDRYQQIRVKIGNRIGGIEHFVGQPVYRLFRKADFHCKPILHSCPLPKDGFRSADLYVPPYIAIWDNKTWTEYLTGLESYERLGRTDLPGLQLARELGLSGADLDRMSIEEVLAAGFGP